MDITVGRWSICGGFGRIGSRCISQHQHKSMRQSENRPATCYGLSTGAGHQFLQKDLPDLYVDVYSTVGEGYAAGSLARLMEQEGIARYLRCSVGGALSSRGMNAHARAAVASRFRSRPTGKHGASVVDIQQAWHQRTPAATAAIMKAGWQACLTLSRSANGAPIEHNTVSVTVIAPTALEADGWDTGLMVLVRKRRRGRPAGRAGGLYRS
ncbi:FAD:protein FMN transferase [Salmonella enterica subsp. enterica]|nr:FAD:protein FMN transferase [Salmonella enterica subsp. enterica]